MTASPLPRAGWITAWLLQITPERSACGDHPSVSGSLHGAIGDWTAHDCFECEILERERVRPE